MSYLTPQLMAQAKEMVDSQFDWYPEACLPDHLMLAAFADGIWVTTSAVVMSDAVKIERVCDGWF